MNFQWNFAFPHPCLVCHKVQFVRWEDPSVTMELTLPAMMMMITQWTLVLPVRKIATSSTRRCSKVTFTLAWFYPASSWKIFLYLKCSSWTHGDKMFIFVFSIWSVHCSFVGGKMWYFVSCSEAGKYVVTGWCSAGAGWCAWHWNMATWYTHTVPLLQYMEFVSQEISNGGLIHLLWR